MTKLSLLGQRFGNLLVVKCAGSDGISSIWEVKCDCGKSTVKKGKDLTKGIKTCSKQCPFNRAKLSKGRTSHGLSQSPIYHVWRSIFARCNNPKCKAYKNYGGRGITVCIQWNTFEGFFSDMGATYQNDLTLDRIDNNKGYFPENCRWVSMKENCRNKRNNRTIETPMGEMLISEAAELSGIRHNTISYRVEHGWPVNKLFLTADFNNRV